MSVSTSRADALAGLTACELADLVASGRVSAVEVLDAHLRRIEEVNGALRALVVPTFERARAEAAAIDAARRRGEPLGPLAGVPVSVKECFDVAGTSTTIGLVNSRGHRAAADGPLVRRLSEAGAVLVGKTNLPQMMLMNESVNPVYGRALHPERADRSPGGSSGGEGALIAAGGSALGLGTDLAGSIRQPCHSCGIAGLKPTTGRLTILGTRDALPGLTTVGVQPGPMARSTADLALAMRVLAAPGLEQIDPRIPPVPWREPAAGVEGLRVACWTDNGFFRPSPAIRRAVDEAAGALTRRGAIVEPWTPPDASRAVELLVGLLSANGGADAKRQLAGDTPIPELRRLLVLSGLPAWLRKPLAAWLAWSGQATAARLVRWVCSTTVEGLWRLDVETAAYEQRFLESLDAGRFDVMLCPPHGLPALGHGTAGDTLPAASYAMLFNLLAMPAGVVGVARVRPGEESDRPESRDAAEQAARRVEQGCAGLPVGVQVAARRWREDLVLASLAAIEAECRVEPPVGCMARSDAPAAHE